MTKRMGKTKLVTVSNAHIKGGIKKSALACPVALALRDATGKPWYVRTGRFESCDNPYYAETPRMPRSVKRFIAAFDNKRPVKPFNFKLICA